MRSEFDPLYIEWRNKVIARDKECQMPQCNRRRRLQAHHIYRWADAPYLRYEERNGVALCPSCHYSIRNVEDNFIDMFRGIVEAKYK